MTCNTGAEYRVMGDLPPIFTIENVESRVSSLQDVNPGSRATYEKSIRAYVRWLRENNRDGWSRDDVLAFKRAQEQAGLSPYTISLRMAALRMLYEAMGHKEIMERVRGMKTPQCFQKDALTVEQAQTLLDSIQGASLVDLRDKAVIALMLCTGVRTVEISRACIGDLRTMGDANILYVQGKGHKFKDDFVKLDSLCLRPIRAYLKARGETGDLSPLFVSHANRSCGQRLQPNSVANMVKARLQAAGLISGKLSAHSLRHTAITLALLGGSSLQEAQAMARHSNIQTTLRYDHSLQRISHAAEDRVSGLLGRRTA